MPRYPLEQLRPGMIPASDVRTRTGQVLVAMGSPLTDKHLAAMKTWGIYTVDLDPASAPQPVLPAERMLVIRRTVALRFKHQRADVPAIRELFRLSVERQMYRTARRG